MQAVSLRGSGLKGGTSKSVDLPIVAGLGGRNFIVISIVGMLIATAKIFVPCKRFNLTMTSTTTVFRNGLIFTGREDATSPVERDIVVAIKNDSIIFVGNETDVQAEQIMQERDVVVVDLQSRSLLPGLIDRSVRSSCV